MEYDIIKLFLKEKVDPLPDCFVAVLLAMTRAITMIPAPHGGSGGLFLYLDNDGFYDAHRLFPGEIIAEPQQRREIQGKPVGEYLPGLGVNVQVFLQGPLADALFEQSPRHPYDQEHFLPDMVPEALRRG